MGRIFKTFSMAALAVLLIPGCASVAHTEKDKTVDLNNYQTFAWVETKENKNDSTQTKVSDLSESVIKEAVTKS